MPSTIACTSSICAKQLAAVTTFAAPYFAVTSRATAGGEVPLNRVDATLVRDLGDVGRFDAENAMTALLEVRNQRAVIGADIDHEVVAAEAEHFRRFRIQLREILAQDAGHPAGVGIFGRKDNDGIDGEPELDQFAFMAVQQAGRKPRLLAFDCPDRNHLVDRRHVTQQGHRLPAGRATRPGRPRPARFPPFLWRGQPSLETSQSPKNPDHARGPSLSCAQYQSTVEGRPISSGTCGE